MVRCRNHPALLDSAPFPSREKTGRFHHSRFRADGRNWLRNGLLQRDIEDHYGKVVAGFELNQTALEKNVSRISPLYCYDIHQRNPEFRAHFDLLFLFDVLEHIEDESGFLQSIKFHLAESGTLLINVPAHQSLYSDYDRAAGHVRRYAAKQLSDIGKRMVSGFAPSPTGACLWFRFCCCGKR